MLAKALDVGVAIHVEEKQTLAHVEEFCQMFFKSYLITGLSSSLSRDAGRAGLL